MLTTLVLILLTSYVLMCVFIFATQRSQIYFATPEADHYGAQVLWLDSAGARLKIWIVRPDAREALIYFGGNAEDVGANIARFSVRFPRHALYLVNYRGYGGSSGRPTERALLQDATVTYDHVARRHHAVDVMGRSLGSAVAVHLGSVRPVRRLVLVTPFDSLARVAQAHFRFLPVALLMLDRYDAAARAPAVRAPVLMVIAGEDEIIPRERSEALAAGFTDGQATVRVIRAAGHNSLDLAAEYLDTVSSFLAREPDP